MWIKELSGNQAQICQGKTHKCLRIWMRLLRNLECPPSFLFYYISKHTIHPNIKIFYFGRTQISYESLFNSPWYLCKGGYWPLSCFKVRECFHAKKGGPCLGPWVIKVQAWNAPRPHTPALPLASAQFPLTESTSALQQNSQAQCLSQLVFRETH